MSEDRLNRIEDAMVDLAVGVKELSSTMNKFMVTEATRIEKDKHQEVLNVEVTKHMKDATPLLDYVKEQKTTTSKMKMALSVAMMFALLGLLGFNLK